MSDGSDLVIVPLGDGRFEVVAGLRRRTAYAVRSGIDTWVFLDGRVYRLSSPAEGRTRHPARQHAAVDDEAALSAPMPATVVSVNVDVGQQVARGDVLVTLEAMKMELAVRAPRDGTVKRIGCQRGELVQAGVPLLELD